MIIRHFTNWAMNFKIKFWHIQIDEWRIDWYIEFTVERFKLVCILKLDGVRNHEHVPVFLSTRFRFVFVLIWCVASNESITIFFFSSILFRSSRIQNFTLQRIVAQCAQSETKTKTKLWSDNATSERLSLVRIHFSCSETEIRNINKMIYDSCFDRARTIAFILHLGQLNIIQCFACSNWIFLFVVR